MVIRFDWWEESKIPPKTELKIVSATLIRFNHNYWEKNGKKNKKWKGNESMKMKEEDNGQEEIYEVD